MSRERHGTGKGSFLTDDKYWDCACEHKYIHLKAVTLECPRCGAREQEQPDSRVREIPLELAD